MSTPAEPGAASARDISAPNALAEADAEAEATTSADTPIVDQDDASDEVTEASMESFPASDPPAWTHDAI